MMSHDTTNTKNTHHEHPNGMFKGFYSHEDPGKVMESRAENALEKDEIFQMCYKNILCDCWFSLSYRHNTKQM